MSRRPINFQGIVELDRGVVDEIDNYLQEKESHLAHKIFEGISSESEPILSSPVLSTLGVHLKLSDAVEGLTKKIRKLSSAQLRDSVGADTGTLVRNLNEILWEMAEVLQGCVFELFQQIAQISIDKWQSSLADVVKSIKDLLIHYIDDLIWVFRRLEIPLHECQVKVASSKRGWVDWFQKRFVELDSSILTYLRDTESYLKSQYDEFHGRYGEFLHLSLKAEESLERMQTFPVLALMDLQDQKRYIEIFRLLKLWELNSRKDSVLAGDIKGSIKNLCSVNNAVKVFNQYYLGLKTAFFKSSLELKSIKCGDSGTEIEGAELDRLKNKVGEYDQELHRLFVTMSLYREFVLKTHVNPYVRCRWGFKEHPVTPEPAKSKSVLNAIYSVEELMRQYERLIDSLDKDPLSTEHLEQENHKQIERLLHEMNQPLISRSMIRNRAESFLKQVQNMDEAGSTRFETIYYLEDAFAKALRSDWKYHVLNEFPLFHQLYAIHQGLLPSIDDPAHASRIERFFRLFTEIEEWVKNGDVYSHIHEIESDVSDMKTYLQDFLAVVQRAGREKFSDPFLHENVDKFRRQLLEYRYVFGKFFLSITSENVDGRQLRNQFLFVDQYFESIENLLKDLKISIEDRKMGS